MSGELKHLNIDIKTGRPITFETVEEMQVVIDEYFEWCDNRIRHFYSKKADAFIEGVDPAPYTMAGLSRRIGLSRRALIDYKSRKDKNGKDFLPTIKAARQKVQEDVEIRMMEGQAAGAIFNLKNNFEYKDKTEVENSGALEVITRKHKRSATSRTADADEDQTDD